MPTESGKIFTGASTCESRVSNGLGLDGDRVGNGKHKTHEANADIVRSKRWTGEFAFEWRDVIEVHQRVEGVESLRPALTHLAHDLKGVDKRVSFNLSLAYCGTKADRFLIRCPAEALDEGFVDRTTRRN